MTEPINVLFITADQWRGECLSALGHPTVKTPHLDALAADGVLFTNHFSQCSPCGPSRASLLTGMYLMNHRSVDNGTPLDARFTNLALEARKAGYDPALIGYTDTSVDPRLYDPKDPILKRGYEGVLPGFTPVLLMPTAPQAWLRYLAEKGYDLPERDFDVYKPLNGYPTIGGFGPFDAPAPYRAEDSDTAFCADAALRFISGQGRESWMLHLVFLRPHAPYIAPEPYNRLYSPDDVPGLYRAATPEDEGRQHPFLAMCLRGRYGVSHIDDGDIRTLRATYYGLMTEVDHHIGRIVAHLKDNGLYDNTLIVFTNDHGETLGDHWLVNKENYFDASFHVPLIVRAPGPAWDAGRGRVVEAFTENVDVSPTILDMLGCDIPAQFDGFSLVPFLGGAAPPRWRQEVHWEFDFRDVEDDTPEVELGLSFAECSLAVIRDRRFKYVHFTALPPLLFDLENDPHELHDLARDPAYATTVLEYAQKMLSWRMAYNERTLTDIKLTRKGLVELSRPRR